MKSLIPLFGLILFFESCITSNHAHYSDPNYLTSNEFNTYEEEAINNISIPEVKKIAQKLIAKKLNVALDFNL